MHTLNWFGRQWRGFGTLERVLVMVFVAGLVLSVRASAPYGASVAAVAYGLIVLSRTGAMATRYQKNVKRAIKPLSRLGSEQHERDRDLRAVLGRIEKTQPPRGLYAKHESLVRAIRELIEARQSQLMHDDLKRYVLTVVALRCETDSWRQLMNEVEVKDSNARSYVKEVCDAMDAFYTKDNDIADRRREGIGTVVANLQEVVPPTRLLYTHRELIGGVARMAELSVHQRMFLRDANEVDLIAASAELAANQESMRRIIRNVRRWR